MKIKITQATFDESKNFLPAGLELDLPTGLCHTLVNAGKATPIDDEGREALRVMIQAKRTQFARTLGR